MINTIEVNAQELILPDLNMEGKKGQIKPKSGLAALCDHFPEQ